MEFYYLYAGCLFSIFDYIGYNKWGLKYNDQNINPYRIVQFIILILTTIGLSVFCKWYDGLFFIGLWLGWVYDWMYYLIDIILIPFGISYEKLSGIKSVYNDECNWAWWTFYGSIKRWFNGKKEIPIKFDILLTQSLIVILIIFLIIKYIIK